MASEFERLAQLLSSVRRRWFMTVALRTAGISMAVAAVPILAASAVYWIFAPAIAGVATVIRRIERRPDDRRVARFIEERVQGMPGNRPMDDCIVSAVHASTIPADDERAPFAALVVPRPWRAARDGAP